MRVLVVEDQADLNASLCDYLVERGHSADAALNGVAGLKLATDQEFDAVVLDLNLPRMDGLTLCRQLRESPRGSVPILMLTARDTVEDKLIGFATGADDYLVKPFSMAELEARLMSLARRQVLNRRSVLRVADLEFDTGSGHVSRQGQVIVLKPKPRCLLELLMRASPNTVSRAAMEYALWGDEPPDGEVLKAHMHLLRSAVDRPFPSPLIHTVRGMGYRLVADA